MVMDTVARPLAEFGERLTADLDVCPGKTVASGRAAADRVAARSMDSGIARIEAPLDVDHESVGMFCDPA